MLWWDGAGEPLPEGRFDLAFTLRPSDWRGTRQAQMEFVDFRLLEEKAAEVRQEVKLIDHRNDEDAMASLAALQDQPSSILWAEGDDKKHLGGHDRNELEYADTLIIWTPPPSPEELRHVIDRVQPQTIHIFAQSPLPEPPEAFLGQLAGLVKYAINQRGGNVTYSALAAATAQREVTVRAGLNWLVTQGDINIKSELEDELVVFIGTSMKDPANSAILWQEVQSLLAETAAYRAHFRRAEIDTLLPDIRK